MGSSSIPFDDVADIYDLTRAFPPGAEAKAISLLAEVGELTASSRVLEAGIGTGRVALPLAPLVSRVVGVDISRPMLEKLTDKRGAECCNPVQGDATRLPFPPAAFDAVIGVHIFHLIPVWRAALDEVRRVLRPGGRLLHAYSGSGAYHLEQEVDRRAPETVIEEVGIGGTTEIGAYLQSQGWQSHPEQRVKYPFIVPPRQYISWTQARYFSRTWRMTDEQVARRAAALEEVFTEVYDDLDFEVDMGGVFAVTAYQKAG